jgi:hypothetical protein
MNGTPVFSIANPLESTMREGEDIIARLGDAASRLSFAIADETECASLARDAASNYEVAETEALAEAIVNGIAKTGPLAGIATSSKAYDLALANLRGQLRDGALFDLARTVDRARAAHERAKVERTQAETEFAALRRVAELKAAILRAACI